MDLDVFLEKWIRKNKLAQFFWKNWFKKYFFGKMDQEIFWKNGLGNSFWKMGQEKLILWIRKNR